MSASIMEFKVIHPNYKYLQVLNNYLLSDGRIRLLPSETYRNIDREQILAWCGLQARYALPTVELIDWLSSIIKGRSAIEIGAGNGDLGYHLGITSTDSYFQQSLEGHPVFAASGQARTNPPSDVVKLDAIAAVRKYKPQVVIASWLTQVYQQDCEDGSVYGVDEELILKSCETYIHIGSRSVHGNKRILKYPHKQYGFPFLISRAFNSKDNVVYVFDGI